MRKVQIIAVAAGLLFTLTASADIKRDSKVTGKTTRHTFRRLYYGG
jgi:hypothetical protein